MIRKYPTLCVIAAVVAMLCLALPSLAQNSKNVQRGAIVIKEVAHDTSPMLREIAPLLPEMSVPAFHEIENYGDPHNPFIGIPYRPDPVLQTEENSPKLQTPPPGVTFDALGFGQSFFCNCMPADNDGAPGANQYVEYVNLFYAVYDKQGNKLLGPVKGNGFWTGFGGGCQNDNWGDPVVRYDAAAGRWVASQFDLGANGNGPFAECIAVSTTSDATGSYNRYSFAFAQFPDYPKMGVWPDAYYFSFNVNGSVSQVCAVDRTKMLAGQSATMQCFNRNTDFGLLPTDLDGPNPPPAGTPNMFLELDRSAKNDLPMYMFHVDFTNPANTTFTGPTKITVPTWTPTCPSATRQACAPQPDAGSDLLETLSDRLMYRLVYRNFGDHSTLLAAHTVSNGTVGGARWYEIHNPETSPTVFQSGTFAPDSQWRIFPSIAMDKNQDIAVGYTRTGSGSGQFPSLVYAGRIPSDPAGTLETENLMWQGTGSQKSGGFDRWGDYSSMTVDPADDCTFWFSQSYIKTTGQNSGFNWSTAVGNFIFPGCSGGPDFSLSANPNQLTIAQGGQGTSTITVNPVNGFNGSVNLSASGQPTGVTIGFNPNPTSSTSTMTVTVGSGVATGTSTITITGTSGSLTHTTTVQLTVTGTGSTLTFTPTNLHWGKRFVGSTSGKKKVVVTNTGSSSVTFSSITISGDFALVPVTQTKKITPCANGLTMNAGASCVIKVTFTPTQVGTRTGDVTFTDNAQGSPQQVPLSGTGK